MYYAVLNPYAFLQINLRRLVAYYVNFDQINLRNVHRSQAINQNIW